MKLNLVLLETRHTLLLQQSLLGDHLSTGLSEVTCNATNSMIYWHVPLISLPPVLISSVCLALANLRLNVKATLRRWARARTSSPDAEPVSRRACVKVSSKSHRTFVNRCGRFFKYIEFLTLSLYSANRFMITRKCIVYRNHRSLKYMSELFHTLLEYILSSSPRKDILKCSNVYIFLRLGNKKACHRFINCFNIISFFLAIG